MFLLYVLPIFILTVFNTHVWLKNPESSKNTILNKGFLWLFFLINIACLIFFVSQIFLESHITDSEVYIVILISIVAILNIYVFLKNLIRISKNGIFSIFKILSIIIAISLISFLVYKNYTRKAEQNFEQCMQTAFKGREIGDPGYCGEVCGRFMCVD